MTLPKEISTSTVATFDLKAVVAALRASPEYARNGRTAQTLAKAPEMNVVLTVLNRDASLSEHQAPGTVTLTVIEGTIEFAGDDAAERLATGCSAVFAAGVSHAVRAVDEAAFLLVIATRN